MILSHFELFFVKSKFISSVRFIRILCIFSFISAFYASLNPLQVINITLVVWLNEALINNDVIFRRYFPYFDNDDIIWLSFILITIGFSLWYCSKSCSPLNNISSTMREICLVSPIFFCFYSQIMLKFFFCFFFQFF